MDDADALYDADLPPYARRALQEFCKARVTLDPEDCVELLLGGIVWALLDVADAVRTCSR